MKRRYVIQAVGMLAICLCTGAYADLHKCKGPDGKTVYSDKRCDDDTQVDKPAPAPAKSASGSQRYELTDSDRERIRVLEASAANPGSNSELKTAAQLEISNIRRGLESSLTRAQRERREALTAGLANADPKQRAQSLGQLRTFYDR
jgi:Domain of unknown function (DUF4124)